MIQIKRHKDKKIFTSDMSKDDVILEIHFSTSYTQVKVQSKKDRNDEVTYLVEDIIIDPIGTQPYWPDLIAAQNDDTGEFI